MLDSGQSRQKHEKSLAKSGSTISAEQAEGGDRAASMELGR